MEATEFTAVQIAIICHEANRAYCELLGDFSQLPWVAAADWQRESVIAGVKAILDAPHYSRSPSESHERWMTHKLKAGWRWGLVKDAEKKEHPSLLPWSELSPNEQRKDILFAAIVRILESPQQLTGLNESDGGANMLNAPVGQGVEVR